MGPARAASINLEVDPNDPIEPLIGNHYSEGPVRVVVPHISVLSEFPSIPRNKGKQQRDAEIDRQLSAVVTIQMPSATDRSYYQARPRQQYLPEPANKGLGLQVPPSPMSSVSTRLPSLRSPFVSPFEGKQADLRRRLEDYDTYQLDSCGEIHLFDILALRRGNTAREFNVYLLRDAIVVAQEEIKKVGLFGKFSQKTPESRLRLKGLLRLRHVRLSDTSKPSLNQFSLLLETSGSEPANLCFKHRDSHETWKNTILRLIENANEPPLPEPYHGRSASHTGSAATSKAAKLMGTTLPAPHNTLSPSVPDYEPVSPVSLCPSDCMGDLAYNTPIAPHHTPIDLVLAVATHEGNAPRKMSILRWCLQFVLASMGPNDRIALVATESGQRGVVRRTPFLNATLHDSRARLELFVELLGSKRDYGHDEFHVTLQTDERPDVATALNCSLDVILQRKSKNPVTNMLIISDDMCNIKKSATNMILARLEAAK
jgi:hypothetical protein